MRAYTDLNPDTLLRKFMTTTFKLFLASLFALSLSACGGGSDTPATPPAPTNPSGSAELTALGIKDITVGTGLQAFSGRTATVRYTGWLYDSTVVESADKPEKAGVEFDTNVGKSPFLFILNSGSVVSGFDAGVLGSGNLAAMKVGGTRIVYIPSALGYGANSSATIPANSALVFRIELLAIQ
jgi:FKBP-type peptidyl-prolyl cis-trans isomerase FkpA